MKKAKTIVFAVAVVLAALFLCSAGCQNVAGGGSGGGSGGSSSGSGGQQGSGWSGINMVSITGGSVPMSTSPSYTPTVSNFSMGETEITQKQYKEILDWAKNDAAVKAKYPDITKANSSPSNFNGSSGKEAVSGENQENRPVEQVTWFDAVMYCNLLTMKEFGESECAYNITNIYYIGSSNGYIALANVTEVTGKKGYRLPTEAEWEYAVRAGNTATSGNQYGNPDPTGANLGDYAWYSANSGSKTHEVKKKLPNSYGLYDMHGNVMEWCWDWYAAYNSGSPSDPHGQSSGTDRICRGSSCFDTLANCAASYRYWVSPSSETTSYGFRVVRR